jgi:hypothetical protein
LVYPVLIQNGARNIKYKDVTIPNRFHQTWMDGLTDWLTDRLYWNVSWRNKVRRWWLDLSCWRLGSMTGFVKNVVKTAEWQNLSTALWSCAMELVI